VRYKATVLLPQTWSIANETVKVEDAAFVYTSKVNAVGRRFTAEYDFRTLADHVDAARVPEYARNLERVRDDASYWLTSSGTAQLPSAGSINIVLILAVLIGAGGGYLLILLVRRRVPDLQPVDASSPSGIAGWLLLPMLHTCLLPITLGVSLYDYWPYLDARTWNAVGEGASDLAIQLLKLGYFTLISGGVALLIAGCYAIFLFFARRRTYPFTWILLMWAMLAWLAIDMSVVIGLPGDDPAGTVLTAKNVGQGFVFCLIWTAYLRKSRRVAATFVRAGSTPAPAPEVPGALPSQTAS
jgi:hypothetical protein